MTAARQPETLHPGPITGLVPSQIFPCSKPEPGDVGSLGVAVHAAHQDLQLFGLTTLMDLHHAEDRRKLPPLLGYSVWKARETATNRRTVAVELNCLAEYFRGRGESGNISWRVWAL